MTKALQLVCAEIGRAEKLHPFWPWDIVHQTAIIAEEAGECLQAGLNSAASEDKNRTACIREAIHTAAVAIRFLQNQDLANYGG